MRFGLFFSISVSMVAITIGLTAWNLTVWDIEIAVVALAIAVCTIVFVVAARFNQEGLE